MALTRKMLKAMGIEDEKIDQIIEEHTESTDALKQQRDDWKAKAESKPATDPKPKDPEPTDEYKAKYDAEKKAFEEYKAGIEAEKSEADKRAKYRELIKEAGVDEKRIDAVLKISDLSGVTVKDGAIENAKKLVEGIKADFKEFIPVVTTEGASVAKPPACDGGTAAPKNLRDALHERYEQKG